MKKLMLFLFLIFAGWQLSNAQTKPVATPTTTKPPAKIKYKAKTCWKNYVDSAEVTAEDGVALLALPITAKAEKNAVYTIVSYTILYKQLGVREDEEFGKTSPATRIISRRFDKTPLNDLWQTSIAEQLHSGEEIQFFDVVIKDAQGKLTLAANLTIKIK